MVLSFRLGKVPVRIAPSFFLMTALLGFGSINDLQVLATWMLVVLASVLVHELGHATMGLSLGLSPRIDLHGMGGTTSWASQHPLSSARRIAISLAGPGFGFAAGGAVVLAKAAFGASVFPPTRMGGLVYDALLEVNFGWGLLN
ncbi:MAG: M50 family metallopeptidase, partial [Polyangiaceae bacterium]